MSATINYLDRLLDPLTECFTPEVAARIANLRADGQTQARIDDLGRKANEGALTEEEREEHLAYVDAIDFVSILQAKARLTLRNHALQE